ncbi:hypothetical protein [Pseudoponticoccus marisrubri]|uniref:Uncharacterized protein n=1 Tax=Pseudoponticoccus marisrubri TaxID=1685382 RepID=A0A0W7WDD8_9RHOB|nr:hypothetical protein [Pseudoponticoccus marisrubri]KUF08656.1 hypothetical protein AVJ23_21625 [Pseudoponticoccus marisrubri]
MNFEDGGLFSKPMGSGHDYFRVREGYAWDFVELEKELQRLGYRIGYESGYIGKSEDDDAVTMSIEIFVGEEIEGDIVEASFDVTVVETDPGKARLTYAPMTGPVSAPGIDYQGPGTHEAISTEPDNAVVVKVAGEIHGLAKIMIPAHKAEGWGRAIESS